jgi:hypothetical protein
MKKILTILLVLCFSLTYAQADQNNKAEANFLHTFPVYKGCEKAKNKKRCFKNKIQTLFSRNFKPDNFKEINTSVGTKKVFILFTIDSLGSINNIKIKAPHPKIELEAKRVLSYVPKCKPGTINGVPTNVKYSLPIIIKIEPKKTSSSIEKRNPWNQTKQRRF